MKEIILVSALLPLMALAFEAPYKVQSILYDQNFKSGDFSIKSKVWNDNNENWDIDNGEKGVSGVTVYLYNPNGKKLISTQSNNNGEYEFKNLPENDYVIKIDVPKGMTAVTDSSLEIYLEKNRTSGKDFGIYTKHNDVYSIKSKVWNDTNENWDIDTTEKGVEGVILTIYKDNGKKVATTKSDDNGNYEFKNLPEDDYVIKIVVPEGMTAVTDSSLEIYLETNRTSGKDFGIVTKNKNIYSIKSKVWYDTNENWEIDNDEKGISHVFIYLYDTNGKRVAVTSSDDNGNYEIKRLPEDDYVIKVVVPEGMKAITNKSLEVYLEKNTISGKDFGIVNTSKKDRLRIRSYVWNDKNHNMIKDGNEKGINGVTLEIYDSMGKKVATEQTKDYLTHMHKRQGYIVRPGYYRFKDLSEDDYTIKVIPPEGFASSTANKLSFWLDKNSKKTYGHLRMRQDNFGIYNKNIKEKYTFRSNVWIDKNNNNRRDWNEGINGVRVNIYNNNGKKIDSTLTSKYHIPHYSEPGVYTFNIEEGTYTIKIEVPKGMSANITEKNIFINKGQMHTLNFQLQSE